MNMIKASTIASFLALFIALVLTGYVVFTSSSVQPTSKIALIDIARVINESDAGIKANAELESFLKAKQAVVDKKAADIEELKKAVASEPKAEAKKSKEAELNKGSAEFQSLLSGSQSEAKKKATDLRAGLLNEIKKTVQSVAANQYKMVLTIDNTVYFEKSVDITDSVIKSYNESQSRQ
jgi:Skp family chaperone for outer membrane proteins